MSAAADPTYWLVAVPNNASTGAVSKGERSQAQMDQEAKLTKRALEMKVAQRLADVVTFAVPQLRVGTLDTLMQLSDELGKIDQQVEGFVKKIKRSYTELKPNKDHQESLLVEGLGPNAYIERWQWNAARYPPAAPLKDLALKLQQDVGQSDDELKKKLGKYTEISTSLQVYERKETGTLLVKPLGPLVKPSDVIEREFLTTLLVIVPKAKEEEFTAQYESLEDIAAAEAKARAKEDEAGGNRAHHGHEDHAAAAAAKRHAADRDALLERARELAEIAQKAAADPKTTLHELQEHQLRANEAKARADELVEEEKAEVRRKDREGKIKNIVPRSGKKLYSDAEFSLFRVVVFKKGADVVKNLLREKRYTVRPYEYDPNQEKSDAEKRNKLADEKNKLLSAMIGWLESQYSQTFSAWIHVKAIRVFVEAVLRFGIPVNFQAHVLKPKKGASSKLRASLLELYGHLAGGALSADAETNASDMAAFGGGEFYPYVYLPVDLTEE